MTETAFATLVTKLWENKAHILSHQAEGWEPDFEYPDYGGLPKRIAYRLSSEAVDAIQTTLYLLGENPKWSRAVFSQRLKENCEVLGEKITGV